MKSVLVTDFDGTITEGDFYILAVQRLLKPEDLAPWQDYRGGRITHFSALKTIISKIRAPESKVLQILEDMRPDPCLRECAAKLKTAGWHVVVASAGCGWYIDRILKENGVDFEVHANPGVYAEGGPLIMEVPVDSPFYSPEAGVDKAGIVRFYAERADKVVYAGDGYTDYDASLLVPPSLRFARAELAGALEKNGKEFRRFSVWSEIVGILLEQGGGS